MAIVKIFKSKDTQMVYIDTVDSALPEDFEYSSTGNLFSINRKNTNIPLVARTNYSQFRGKNEQGEEISFATKTSLENYLDQIFTQETNNNSGTGFFPKPISTLVNKFIFNHNETRTIDIPGSYFTPNTIVTIGSLQVSSVTVSGTLLRVTVTANDQDSLNDIVITNESGSITLVNLFEIKLSTWIDLRLNGEPLSTGTDIRVRTGMNITRDAQGMSFAGSNPWQSWVKFEKFIWNRNENKTCQWIFTRPTAAFMIGIGSTATNETSRTQYTQGEVLAYFSSSTSFWGLYGNNGTVGSTGNQVNTIDIGNTTGIFKIKFENSGSKGATFTLYELPSSNQSDWDNESNILSTFTINGSLNPDEENIMPFIIPRSASTQRFIALKVN